MIRIQFLVGEENFSLWHHVQTISGAHRASYPMGTGGSFPGAKWLGHEANPSPPSSVDVKECVDLWFHSPNTPPWCDAHLKRLYVHWQEEKMKYVTKLSAVTSRPVMYNKSQGMHWENTKIWRICFFSCATHDILEVRSTPNFRWLVVTLTDTLLTGDRTRNHGEESFLGSLQLLTRARIPPTLTYSEGLLPFSQQPPICT